MQRLARAVPIAPHVTAYAVSVLAATHPDNRRAPGARPPVRPLRRLAARRPGARHRRARSGRSWTAASTCRVDDVRAVALPALRHRVILNFEGEAEGITTEAVVRTILDEVAPPSVE